jgi:hypothetical protein
MNKLIFICVLVFTLGFVTGNAFSQTTTTTFVTTTSMPPVTTTSMPPVTTTSIPPVTTTTAPVTTTSPVTSQDFCKGDFNYNGSVAAEDVAEFLNHFGRNPFFNPCPPDGPAPVAKTGQTTCYAPTGYVINCAGTGHDGEYQKGVAWPVPRFNDNSDGTITDTVTGLIWLKSANCSGQRTWNEALSDASGLADGNCGLTDGSSPGDWRLPNLFELESLCDMQYYAPALSNRAGTGKWTEGNPFFNVQSNLYWSSTTDVSNTAHAWFVGMQHCTANFFSKDDWLYVWPVRGGH